eukprot:2071121-Pleurochrysis_carterae.AAC.3
MDPAFRQKLGELSRLKLTSVVAVQGSDDAQRTGRVLVGQGCEGGDELVNVRRSFRLCDRPRESVHIESHTVHSAHEGTSYVGVHQASRVRGFVSITVVRQARRVGFDACVTSVVPAARKSGGSRVGCERGQRTEARGSRVKSTMHVTCSVRRGHDAYVMRRFRCVGGQAPSSSVRVGCPEATCANTPFVETAFASEW